MKGDPCVSHSLLYTQCLTYVGWEGMLSNVCWMNKQMNELRETIRNCWLNEEKWREAFHVLMIYWQSGLLNLTLWKSFLYTLAFHFQSLQLFCGLSDLPLIGKAAVSLIIGALLLEITCSKYSKSLGRVERVWPVEPEDLCLDLMFATWCLYELGEIKYSVSLSELGVAERINTIV